MICDLCGKVFESGNREDGLPNGVGFIAEDGVEITICTDCLLYIDLSNVYERNPVLEVVKRKRRMVQ